MEFMMHMIPPTVTHQEKKVTIKNGKPVFYEPPALADAREKLTAYLAEHSPVKPFKGPLKLVAVWSWWDANKPDTAFRVTKPDTDNLQKLLKDCMTALHYWDDDAQVTIEYVSKIWVAEPKDAGIWIKLDQLPETMEEFYL